MTTKYIPACIRPNSPWYDGFFGYEFEFYSCSKHKCETDNKDISIHSDLILKFIPNDWQLLRYKIFHWYLKERPNHWIKKLKWAKSQLKTLGSKPTSYIELWNHMTFSLSIKKESQIAFKHTRESAQY